MSNPVTDVEPLRNAMLFVHSGKKYIYIDHPLLFELTHSPDEVTLTQIKDAALYKTLMADVETCIASFVPEARAIADVLSGKKLDES